MGTIVNDWYLDMFPHTDSAKNSMDMFPRT